MISNEHKGRPSQPRSPNGSQISQGTILGPNCGLLHRATLEDRQMRFPAVLHAKLKDDSFADKVPSILRSKVLPMVRHKTMDLDTSLVLESEDHFLGSHLSGGSSRINEPNREAVNDAQTTALNAERSQPLSGESSMQPIGCAYSDTECNRYPQVWRRIESITEFNYFLTDNLDERSSSS